MRASTCLSVATALTLSTTAYAQFELCEVDPATIPGAPRFAAYAVPPGPAITPHAVVIRSADDRLFRTMLRRGAATGPNFAGHYTMVAWGCGTSCVSFSFVNARTGRVFFDPVISHTATNHINDKVPPYEYNGLAFRSDSRLLAVTGLVNEQEARDGVSYFTWNGRALRLVRFIPVATLCPPRSTSPAR